MWKKEELSVQQLWEQSNTTLPILVRSDEVLEEVVINDAQVLIHYNLPNTYKTFGLRFACILDNFRNILKKVINIFFFSIKHFFMDKIVFGNYCDIIVF